MHSGKWENTPQTITFGRVLARSMFLVCSEVFCLRRLAVRATSGAGGDEIVPRSLLPSTSPSPRRPHRQLPPLRLHPYHHIRHLLLHRLTSTLKADTPGRTDPLSDSSNLHNNGCETPAVFNPCSADEETEAPATEKVNPPVRECMSGKESLTPRTSDSSSHGPTTTLYSLSVS